MSDDLLIFSWAVTVIDRFTGLSVIRQRFEARTADAEARHNECFCRLARAWPGRFKSTLRRAGTPHAWAFNG
jgi:hypothetical protein